MLLLTYPDALFLFAMYGVSALLFDVSHIFHSICVRHIFQMIIGHTYKIAVGIIALICSLSCFSNDKNNADITEFSKALGVFFYLMIRRSKPTAFLSQLFSQVIQKKLTASGLPRGFHRNGKPLEAPFKPKLIRV